MSLLTSASLSQAAYPIRRHRHYIQHPRTDDKLTRGVTRSAIARRARVSSATRGAGWSPRVFASSAEGTAGGDDAQPEGDVREISTKNQLDYIIQIEGKEKVVVLEVRRSKSRTSEEFAQKFKELAKDFPKEAIFAQLLCDKDEQSKALLDTLKAEQVPAFFMWKNGQLQDEYSGTSYETLHHAIARYYLRWWPTRSGRLSVIS